MERARSDSRAPGGSVASWSRTRIPARLPGPLPQGSGAKRRLLPNNSDLHSRNNASGEAESSEAAAPGAREPTTYGRARVRAAPGRRDPERKGHKAGRPVGVAARGEARTAEVPGAQRRGPGPVAAGKKAGATRPPPPAMNRAFSQCVVQAWPPRARVRGRGPARPEPAAVTQGRPRSLCSGPGRPVPTSPPAPPPFRRPRRLRPRRVPGLGRSGASHCDTAAPGRACAASPRRRRRDTHPHFPGAERAPATSPPGRWARAPVNPVPPRSGCVRPPPGPPRLELRATRLPPPPPPLPALLPPPAPRNLRPLAFPLRLPPSRPRRLRRPRGRGCWAGPERTARGVRARSRETVAIAPPARARWGPGSCPPPPPPRAPRPARPRPRSRE